MKKQNLWLTALAFFALHSQVAKAGLLDVATSIASKSANSSDVSLKTLVKSEDLFRVVIKDLAGQASGSITSGSLRTALKGDLTKFLVSGSKVTWERADIADYMKQLLSRKCSVNVSCEIAFDLRPSAVDDFLDGLAGEIQIASARLRMEKGAQAPNLRAAEEAGNKLYRPIENAELDALRARCG